MNITKVQKDALNGTIRVQLEKKDYAERVENALKGYQQKVVVDGFRKGKTPLGLVKKMYGKAILMDELNKLLQEAVAIYIDDNKLHILGEPLPNETEQKELDLEQDDFEFVYDFALVPEMDVKLTKKDKITYYMIKADDEMIDKQIENLRKNNGEMQDVDVVEGTEYLKGKMEELDADGNVREGGVQNSDSSFSLQYVKDEDVINKFKGAKIGDTLQLDVLKAFPNKTDFSSMLGISKEDAEEVNPIFSFTVNEIKRFVEAEMNTAFFDRVYGEDATKTEKEFRDRVKDDIQQQLKSYSAYRFPFDAREKLLKKNADVAMPDAFLKRWVAVSSKETDMEEIERDFEKYRDEFKWQIIQNRLSEEYAIKIEKEDIQHAARQVASSQLQQYGLYRLTNEQLDGFALKLIQNEKQHRRLYDMALDAKIFATIRENAKLEEEEITMADFEKLYKK
ncbi:trigger factor [Bacteroidia bacterium]|nr:trigger factor [Bacteroidia bacterium]